MAKRLCVLGACLFVWMFVAIAPAGLAVSIVAAQSRVTIVGSVVDASLSPLSGVAIALERGGRVEAKTTTDDRGAFRFADVAAGDYRVRAEHAGFPPLLRDLHVPTGVTNLRLPIVLARAEDALPAASPDVAASGAIT